MTAAAHALSFANTWSPAEDEILETRPEIRRGRTVRVHVYRLTEKLGVLPDCGYKDVAAELLAADAAAKMEERHGSHETEAVAPCGTDAHPLVGSEGQQPIDRTGAQLAMCPGPKTGGGPCPSP